MEYFYLEITRGNNSGKRYPLIDGVISIGRSNDNVIRFDQNERIVSSHHAIIYKYPESITIQDLSSMNGTFVNEKKISQEEIVPGDIIGFGETGPRLKLIVSKEEFPASSFVTHGGTFSETDETEHNIARKTGVTIDTLGDPQKRPSKGKILRDTTKDDIGSLTLEMENKLLNKKISGEELNSLMNQSERLGKILQNGNLNDTQTHFLYTAYDAHKKSQNRWIAIVGIVAGISLLTILFFAIRMFQYKNQLNKALRLEKTLDNYEKKIDKAKATGSGDKDLSVLISEFEKTEGQFNTVKATIKTDDYQRFFEDTVESYINDIMTRFGESDYHIPPQMVERVKYHLNVYSGQLKPIISHYLQRKTVYFPMICRVFSERRIPLELAYVSMLESGFNPKALSPVGARGLWQFMPATGKRYGLQIDDAVDERIDPEKETYAASEFFKDLISIFGGKSSVMLVMASYNAGENRVMGALKKIDDPMRNRDFWYIYRMGYLAEETNEYIPRVLALMIIDEHKTQYGFSSLSPSVITNALEDEKDFIPQVRASNQ